MNKNKIANILKSNAVAQYTLSGEIKDTDLLKNKLGYLPMSILDIDWQQTKILKEYVGDIGNSRKDTKCSTGFDGKKVSIFNPYLCKCMLNGYAPKHANIYDPFAGGGTRAIISTTMGHTYTGCEIRKEEVDNVKARGKELGLDFSVLHEDARNYINNNEFNFSLTCPPYYNLEQYNGGENDLSMATTYGTFMQDITEVMKNVYMSLKLNSYCIWIVGNFRDKKGNLIDFRGDVVRSARKVGFIFHDDIVIHSAAGSAAQRVKMFEANKKSVRIHEYALIFKKV